MLYFSTQQETTNIATALKRKLPKGLFIFPFEKKVDMKKTLSRPHMTLHLTYTRNYTAKIKKNIT